MVVVLAGCGGDGAKHNPDAAMADAATDAASDGATDAAGDAAMTQEADIATTLQCGPTPATPPLQMDMQKAIIDTAKFPDALCNDGTPAVIYYRPYTGAANRNKWVLNFHGGGSCSNAAECAARWCNCANTTQCPFTTETTNFDRLTMTNARSATIGGNGVFERGGTGVLANPIGDYNQVEFEYCTSDTWRGNLRGVEFTTPNPKTGASVTYHINFLGAKVADADIAWLRQDGVAGLVYTLGGANTPMPDLDDASDVIVTGDSAGGVGLVFNLDRIRDDLVAHNTSAAQLRVSGLMDASTGPDRSTLDYGTYAVSTVRTYDQYLTWRNQSPGRGDASCLARHMADPRICADDTHVLRNHVTTPFFIRMALRDSQISGNYIAEMLRTPNLMPITANSFGLRLHDELGTFGSLPSMAEEGGLMSKAPGVFAPGCTKHDTIRESTQTFGTTITPAGGSALTLLTVFENWRNASGTPTVLLTESVTLADTTCP